jgi:heme O synthase-like polyprenyltransferase
MVQQQRVLRIVQICFLVYAIGLFWLMHIIKPQNGSPADPVVYQSIAALAVADGFIGILMQRLMLKAKARPLPNGKVPTAAQRWFAANIVRLAFALSTCLFGFALHMLVAPVRLAQALVALGILFLLVSPCKPPADEPGSSPHGTIG